MSRRPPPPSELRRRAEAVSKQLNDHLADSEPPGVDEMRRLIHELDVHQAELEIQNEELRRAEDELEQVNARFRDLYDFAPVGYLTLNPDHTIKEANLSFVTLIQSDRSRLIDTPFVHIIHPSARLILTKRLKSLGRHNDMGTFDCQLWKPGGTTIDVRLRCLPVTEGKHLREIRVSVTDITSERARDEQRKLFFSIASHELRTPVTNIGLSLDLVLNGQLGELSDDAREMVAVARRGARRLERLVQDIRVMSAAGLSGMKIEKNPLDLSRLLEEAISASQPTAHNLGISINTRTREEAVKVSGDAGRLMQVIGNLVDNAMRFSDPGKQVEVSLLTHRDSAHVAVSDSGSGIADEHRERIFEPFFQANPSLEGERHDGTVGLGLAIAKTIIEAHDGQIGFESRPGLNTTFWFDLPLHCD